VRKGLSRSAAALVLATIWFSTDLAPATMAQSPAKEETTLGESTRAASDSLVPLSMDEIQLRIDVTSKELRVASEQYNQLDRDLALAAVATDELKEEASVVAEVTLKNAIDGYRHSEVPRGLLVADDLTDSMRAAALGGAAVSADTESFDAYRDLRKDLEIEEAELALKEEQTAEAGVELGELEEQLEGELSWFGELEERRLQEQAILVQVQATNRAQARGRKQGYYLDTCPVNGSHSFIDSWGFARSGGRRHQGVDILAATGTELVAPVSGRVEHFANSLGGRSYRLFGDDGNYFYGTHLSAYGKEGQVNAGEVIGYVGDDGNAAGIPHLHFEIHPGGRGNPINPFIDSAAVCSGAQY
jgi:murein DD-endopeptidase MepM/ murein hydrolase activator NlpD